MLGWNERPSAREQDNDHHGRGLSLPRPRPAHSNRKVFFVVGGHMNYSMDQELNSGKFWGGFCLTAHCGKFCIRNISVTRPTPVAYLDRSTMLVSQSLSPFRMATRLLLFPTQDGERSHATAALVPSSARAGPHVRRRAILGKGLPVHAAHRTKVVLPRVSRWGHRLSDNQVAISLHVKICTYQ